MVEDCMYVYIDLCMICMYVYRYLYLSIWIFLNEWMEGQGQYSNALHGFSLRHEAPYV